MEKNCEYKSELFANYFDQVRKVLGVIHKYNKGYE